MRILDILSRETDTIDYADIDSIEKAYQLYTEHKLGIIYLLPLPFGGEPVTMNTLYVPTEIASLKERSDNVVVKMYREGNVNFYSCNPTFKGNSVIPKQLTITALHNDNNVLTEVINVY